MKNKNINFIVLISFLCFVLVQCSSDKRQTQSGTLNVVTTTTMITDLLHNIGGDKVEINGLMGAGVDPHLYKASEGDVNKLFHADVVFYNGLHLEGKLVDVFEKMQEKGSEIIAISDGIDHNKLISSSDFASNYDPHIWFNTDFWRNAAEYVEQNLSRIDSVNASYYHNNYIAYSKQIDSLEAVLNRKIDSLPVENRILITAHDAFNYFGMKFNFQVLGLQGLSTATEAGVRDVQNMAQLIVDKKIKAIFIESSVPVRNIEALQEAVKAKGFAVSIGGQLYSDALGSADTEEGSYIGMYLYNVSTIINALK